MKYRCRKRPRGSRFYSFCASSIDLVNRARINTYEESMSENTKVCVLVDLSDFAQNLQVGSLWGVDRLCKALENVSEGNLEICIPLKNGRNITLLV